MTDLNEPFIIKAPKRIQDSKKYYKWLGTLQNQIINTFHSTIDIDFAESIFSHAVFTSFFGALVMVGNHYGKTVRIRYNGQSAVGQYFNKSGLVGYFQKAAGTNIMSEYPYSIDFSPIDVTDESIMEYIDGIIGLFPLNLSNSAKSALFSSLYEICNNSAEHSNSICGTYGCGHWMPTQKKLFFSLYDTGVGIPSLVKYHVDPSMDSLSALKWALTEGNSTRQMEGNTPRGLGLTNLLRFISISGNSLTILSNDLYFHYKGNDYEYDYLDSPIIGTFISMSIKEDPNHYYAYGQKED